jgi:rSAM/selenodomain-associated transferase 1
VVDETAKRCVLLFVKPPIAGEVKTRLGTEIGEEQAAELYKCFVLDLLSQLKQLGVAFRICYSPVENSEQISQWLGAEHEFIPQQGLNLGERMENAFLDAFDNNFNQAVIIGSDSPDLPEDFLELSFSALETHDVVIGPASDGGYYLIGFTQAAFLPETFEAIRWSSDSVFEQTVNILKQHKRDMYLLPQWYDVDTLGDLKSLLERNKNTTFRQSRTFSYLVADKSWSKFNV